MVSKMCCRSPRLILVLHILSVNCFDLEKLQIQLGFLASETPNALTAAGGNNTSIRREVMKELYRNAIIVAVEDMQSNYTNLKFSGKDPKDYYHKVHYQSCCNGCETAILGNTADFIYNNKDNAAVDAVIGPVCTVSCTMIGTLAAHSKIPVISYGCSGPKLSEELTFSRTKAWARTRPAVLAEFLLKIANALGWKEYAIAYSDDLSWQNCEEKVREVLETGKIEVNSKKFEDGAGNFEKWMQELKRYNRSK